MSRFRIWITADKLMQRWGIEPIDLADYVLEEKLTAYHTDMTPIDLDFERKSFSEKLKYWQELHDNLEIWIGIVDLSYLDKKIINYIFKYKEVIDIENEIDAGKEIKLRLVQRHREECRQIAKSIWEQTPNLSIAEMIRRDEIKKIRDEKKPNPYNEKTVRNWINDLCPVRKPGRRPKPR
jgi:hypothetical protein